MKDNDELCDECDEVGRWLVERPNDSWDALYCDEHLPADLIDVAIDLKVP